MLEGLQEILTVIATGTGIYVGVGGLNAWKRETTGKRDIELCQKVVELFYEAEEKMSALRSPMSFGFEGADRKSETPESAEEKQRRNTLFVPLARFNKQLDFWLGLQAYKFRMRALFGEEAVKPFDAVDLSLREFRAAASTRYQVLFASAEVRGEITREFEKTIWESSTEDDVIARRMKASIKDVEDICIPIVRTSRNETLLGLAKRVLRGRGKVGQ